MSLLFNILSDKFNPTNIGQVLTAADADDIPSFDFHHKGLEISSDVAYVVHAAADNGFDAIFQALVNDIPAGTTAFCKHVFEAAQHLISTFNTPAKNGSMSNTANGMQVISGDDKLKEFTEFTLRKIKLLLTQRLTHVTEHQFNNQQAKFIAETLGITTWDVGLLVLSGVSAAAYHECFFDISSMTEKDWAYYMSLGHEIKPQGSLNELGSPYYLCENHIPDHIIANPIITGLHRLQSANYTYPVAYSKRRFDIFKRVYNECAQANFALEEFIAHEFDDLMIIDSGSEKSQMTKLLVDFSFEHGGIKTQPMPPFSRLDVILLILRYPRSLFSEPHDSKTAIDRINSVITSIATRRSTLEALDSYVEQLLLDSPTPSQALEICEQVLHSLTPHTKEKNSTVKQYSAAEYVFCMATDDMPLPHLCELLGQALSALSEDDKKTMISKIGLIMPIKSWDYLVSKVFSRKVDVEHLIESCRYYQNDGFFYANPVVHIEAVSDLAASCERKFHGCASTFFDINIPCVEGDDKFHEALVRKLNADKKLDVSIEGNADMSFLSAPAL